MAVLGIDVSHHQEHTPDLTGLSFLWARATYGTNVDDRFVQHTTAARQAGLLVGAYHFGRHGSPVAQARAFLQAAGDVDFYALDLENDAGSPDMTRLEARAFIAAVQAAGHKVGLYHSESGFPWVGQTYNWVAKWSATPPAIAWTFWQYRGAPLDLDRFNGTTAALAALAGRLLPDTSTEDPMIPISKNSVPTHAYDVDLSIGDQLYDQAFRPSVRAARATTVPGFFVTGTGYIAIGVTTGGQLQLAFARAGDVTYRPVLLPAPLTATPLSPGLYEVK